MRVSVENRPVPLLLFAAVPVFFLWLGANSIWDANEAFYVETPRQMVLSGDYINPSFNDAGRFNKPVLSYWVVAALYQLFGISIAVERLGIAVGALGIALAAFLIGRALRSPRAGMLAALFVVTAPRFVFWSRRIFIDIYITLFMALTLAFFVMAERYPQHRRRFLLLTYAAIGLGVLTKGPVAIVLPAAVLVAWLAAERRLGDVRRLMIVPGLAVVAAIVAPWYIALYVQHGWEHIVSFFVGENIGRFTSAMVPEGRGLGFYVPVLLTDLFPWAPFVVVPLVAIGVSQWRRPASPDSASDRIRRLLWWWIVVIVGAFSLSETKQDLYIFPVVPAVAVLVADAFVSSARSDRRGVLGWMLVAVGTLTMLSSFVVFRLFGPAGGAWQLAGAGTGAVLLGITGSAVAVLELTRRRAAAIATLAAGFILFNYLFVAVVAPDLERFKPVPAAAATYRERASPGARLAQFEQSLPSLVFYAGRPVEDLPTLDAAAEALAGEAEVWLLVPERHGAVLRERAPSSCVALRHPIFDLTPRQVMEGRPPSAVELLTNRCGTAGRR
jgi:4-amino-4-deoxy-L-arabinose transferase-like glycosyltransferase